MTKSCRIGLWSVGFALLVCGCSNASDSGAKGPAGSGGSGASGAPDNSAGTDTSGAGMDTSSGGTDASNGGADTSNGGADTGSGGTDTSAGGTAVVVDPNACNAIPIDAPAVAASAGVGQKPIPAGGTIVDGKYYLTAHETFNGVDPTPANYRTVIVISGAELQLAQIKDGTESRATFDVTTTMPDKHFHAATTCPGPGQSLAYDYYTATSDSLLLFDNEKVVTLTLQP